MKKVALVTGAARGIGRGIAERLAEHGFNIGIVYVSADDAAQQAVQACKAHGVNAIAIKADISKPSGRETILTELEMQFDRIDILVNNAGVAPKVRMDLLEATEESYDWVMDVNLKGPYFLTQHIAKRMIQAKKQNDSTHPMIINISSISAYTSSPARGEYCLSKAGMSMMTQLYADRLSEYDIPVYEVRPGIIETDMTSAVKEKYDRLILREGLTPLKRWGTPDDIAKAVTALAMEYFPFSTGQVLDVDGGFHMKRL